MLKKELLSVQVLLRADNPFENTAIHEREAFGPVSTIMPYKNLDEAITLAQMGKGFFGIFYCNKRMTLLPKSM